LFNKWLGVYAFSIREDGQKILDRMGYIGQVPGTSNEVEIQGALKALNLVQERFPKNKIEIQTDNYSARDVLRYKIDLSEISGGVEVYKVPRKELFEPDFLCDLAWKNLPKIEPKLGLENFPTKQNGKADYVHHFLELSAKTSLVRNCQ